MRVHGPLKAYNVYLRYTIGELENDLASRFALSNSKSRHRLIPTAEEAQKRPAMLSSERCERVNGNPWD